MFHRIRNAVDYPLRQFFAWRRKPLIFKNESKELLFADSSLEIRKKAHELLNNYQLMDFFNNSSKRNYRINLYYLQLLEKALAESGFEIPERVVAVDIGPSDWFYIQALYHFLGLWQRENKRVVELYGYEIDAYRVYQNFYSRFDRALGHIRELENVVYIPEGFHVEVDRYDMAFMFFPFIFNKDHLAWGLPIGLFDPLQLLNNVLASMKTGGCLLIVNQGEDEHRAQLDMLEKLDCKVRSAFRFESGFFIYKIPHYVTVVLK